MRRLPYRAVQWRRHVDARRRAGLPVRTALSGPAAGVIAAAAMSRGLQAIRDVITGRSRRHLLRRLADRWMGKRRSPRRRRSISAWSSATPMIEITDHRRRRRLHRPGRPPVACSRSARRARARRPGPGGLWPGQRAPDVDGRQHRARPHRRRTPNWRQPCSGSTVEAAAGGDRHVHVGEPLGLSTEAAAEALSCASQMPAWPARIRLVSIERGHDPATLCARCLLAAAVRCMPVR